MIQKPFNEPLIPNLPIERPNQPIQKPNVQTSDIPKQVPVNISTILTRPIDEYKKILNENLLLAGETNEMLKKILTNKSPQEIMINKPIFNENIQPFININQTQAKLSDIIKAIIMINKLQKNNFKLNKLTGNTNLLDSNNNDMDLNDLNGNSNLFNISNDLKNDIADKFKIDKNLNKDENGNGNKNLNGYKNLNKNGNGNKHLNGNENLNKDENGNRNKNLNKFSNDKFKSSDNLPDEIHYKESFNKTIKGSNKTDAIKLINSMGDFPINKFKVHKNQPNRPIDKTSSENLKGKFNNKMQGNNLVDKFNKNKEDGFDKNKEDKSDQDDEYYDEDDDDNEYVSLKIKFKV